jgi:hypothetical protein
MYGLPITLTPQQQVACGAKKWKGLTQTEQMGVLISLFAQIADVQLTCQSLATLAAQYSCLPPQLQLPALIYLATQIIEGVTLENIQVFSTVGTPTFSPPVSVAIALDNTTIPGQVAAWVWQNSVWTQFLG